MIITTDLPEFFFQEGPFLFISISSWTDFPLLDIITIILRINNSQIQWGRGSIVLSLKFTSKSRENDWKRPTLPMLLF